MSAPENQGSSTRPYLLRALHDWCTDNGFTPYIAVHVDASVQVPQEHVRNNEIVLNIGFEATTALKLGNEFIEFKARFGGVAREIVVPIDHVLAIYARENGQGMAFPMPAAAGAEGAGPSTLPPPGAAQASPNPTPGPRGLRLARRGSEAPVRRGGAAAQSSSPGPSAGPAHGPTAGPADAPDPPEPSSPRPSLKRIK